MVLEPGCPARSCALITNCQGDRDRLALPYNQYGAVGMAADPVAHASHQVPLNLAEAAAAHNKKVKSAGFDLFTDFFGRVSHSDAGGDVQAVPGQLFFRKAQNFPALLDEFVDDVLVDVSHTVGGHVVEGRQGGDHMEEGESGPQF